MDHGSSTRTRPSREQPDLAAIVLGDRGMHLRGERRGTSPAAHGGYDARSALVLAVVVGAIAAAIGWTMTSERTATPPAEPSVTTRSDARPAAAPAEEGEPASAVEPDRGEAASSFTAPPGIGLAPTRIQAGRSDAGSGLLRVRVVNRGSRPLPAGSEVQVLFLLDGAVAGERTIASIDPPGARTAELALDTCPPGRHAAVAIVDPRGLVDEVDERDNASSRMVSFGC